MCYTTPKNILVPFPLPPLLLNSSPVLLPLSSKAPGIIDSANNTRIASAANEDVYQYNVI